MAGGGGAGQPMGGSQPMGGGQQGGFGGNQMGGGFNQQPMQQPMGGFGGGYGQQQMQQPMGGFGQMGGGYGQMGGFGGGYGQYGQMRGGFGQQQQMGGFGGQMGGFSQQPMGGFGGGFNGGMDSGINTYPGPQQSQGGRPMNPMQGAQMMMQRFGQQGGMGQQNMQQQPSSSGFANVSPETLQAERMAQLGGQGGISALGMQGQMQQGGMGLANGMSGLGQSPGMSGTASPQANAAYQAAMNRSAGRPDNYGQSVGQSLMSPQTLGALSNPGQMGGMNQIPAYARSYAQNQMGSLPTQSQMMGTQAPQGRSMTPDEFTAMMQSSYGRSA